MKKIRKHRVRGVFVEVWEEFSTGPFGVTRFDGMAIVLSREQSREYSAAFGFTGPSVMKESVVLKCVRLERRRAWKRIRETMAHYREP